MLIRQVASEEPPESCRTEGVKYRFEFLCSSYRRIMLPS